MGTPEGEQIRLTSLSRGAGCACKLPLSRLENLFSSLSSGLSPASGDLLIGALEGDDAAVLRLDDSRALVLTTDFFTPIVDDAYDWGRIAAANALSDVYAMGGTPLIAVNLAAWPGENLPIELLGDTLRGGVAVADAARCHVVGGHTIDDPIPKYGMAVVGIADPQRLFTIDRAKPGDVLVLTKPIGTGVVTTALKHGGVDGTTLATAVRFMTTLNAAASEVALAAGVRAATDVTGFGVAGHLHRMLRASRVAAEIYANQVPLLPRAEELVTAGFVSGGTRANMAHLADSIETDDEVSKPLNVLLHDAQTSGGLLLACPENYSELCEQLRRDGLPATVVGRVVAGPPGRIRVRATEPRM